MTIIIILLSFPIGMEIFKPYSSITGIKSNNPARKPPNLLPIQSKSEQTTGQVIERNQGE